MSDLSAANAGGMNQWMSRTATVLATFPTWSAGVRCLDLAEELVELARAILIAEERKWATEREEPVAQALCGVLFDVFALAQHYGVDLDLRRWVRLVAAIDAVVLAQGREAETARRSSFQDQWSA